jgi:hypothetical protein
VSPGQGRELAAQIAGEPCQLGGLPTTTTVTVQVTDDNTPVDKLAVTLYYVYRDSTGWLTDTWSQVPMRYAGNGRYSAQLGPFALTTNYTIGYYVAVQDSAGATAATATTYDALTTLQVNGCVIIR